jgi:hypothetical protein
MALLNQSLSQYKSSLYETARSLLSSRKTQAARAERLQRENQVLRSQEQQAVEALQRKQQQLDQITLLHDQQLQENQSLRERPVMLPSDLPLPGHHFGPKMICLCLKLVQRLGFRPSQAALEIVFEFLGIDAKIPSHDSMRSWSLRVGIALLQKEHPSADDWIWMSDHSNQIGSEKVLLILGIRARDLPPLGETLSRTKLKTLALVPGQSWKRDDVRREYQKLAQRIGPPRYLLTDGAVELHETADVLEKAGENAGQTPIVLRDMKHFAANTFEKLIGKSDRFTEYMSKLGRTRCQIQQTELSHFVPPPQKPKSRFMNLGPVLHWGEMVSYHLGHRHSAARSAISAARMNEKLGWLRDFRDDLASWNRCEAIIQRSLTFINTMGVYRGSADGLREKLDEQLGSWPESCPQSQAMSEKLVEFVRAGECQLDAHERAWLSTENLESSFGAFKCLEGQHSKGGFTSLIAALPMVLTELSVELIRESLQEVPVAKMKSWVSINLGRTLSSKRNQAYREFNAATSG